MESLTKNTEFGRRLRENILTVFATCLLLGCATSQKPKLAPPKNAPACEASASESKEISPAEDFRKKRKKKKVSKIERALAAAQTLAGSTGILNKDLEDLLAIVDIVSKDSPAWQKAWIVWQSQWKRNRELKNALDVILAGAKGQFSDEGQRQKYESLLGTYQEREKLLQMLYTKFQFHYVDPERHFPAAN